MSVGFKVKPPAPPEPAIAPAGTVACHEKWPGEHGTYCERPKGHEGGHLSQSHGKYWQAEGTQS